MVKEKRILSYFLCWLILLFLVCFVGISNVFAATYYTNYSYSQQYYDNRGSSVVAVNTTWNESLQSYVSDNITTAANSYGAGLSITSPIPLLNNHTYTLSIYFEGTNNIAKSSKSNIAISTSLDGASYNYANNNFYTETLQTNVNNNSIIQFVFKVNSGGEYIFIPWTTIQTVTQNYVITQINMEDLGSEGISQNDINNSLNNQTNILNESIQNSTNIITGEIDDMQQSIIDSNKETQDVIKDQFNSCHESVNLFDKNTFEKGYAFINSTKTANANWGIYWYLAKPNTTYTISGLKNYAGTDIVYTDINKNVINRLVYRNGGTKYTFTTGSETGYIGVSFVWSNSASQGSSADTIQLQEGNIATSYEPFGEEICSNKIDETNNQLGDLNNSLNDSNVDGSLGSAGSFFDNFSTIDHGGLSGIITAPLVAINQMLNTNCSPMTTTFKGKELSLPCGYEFWNRLGAIQNFINIVLGGMLCYRIIIKLYKLIERIKNPEDDRLEVMDL